MPDSSKDLERKVRARAYKMSLWCPMWLFYLLMWYSIEVRVPRTPFGRKREST